MRHSKVLLIIALCVVVGCALFPEQPVSSLLTNNVSSRDLQALSPGEWCRVRLVEVREGHNHTHAEHIGQIKRVDADSMTMTHVTTRRLVINDLSSAPLVGRLYKTTGIAEEETAEVTLSRRGMALVERLTVQRAEELKQPLYQAEADVKDNPPADNQNAPGIISL